MPSIPATEQELPQLQAETKSGKTLTVMNQYQSWKNKIPRRQQAQLAAASEIDEEQVSKEKQSPNVKKAWKTVSKLDLR